ncbi:MAG: hypothetical protein C4K49_11415 [Candidatus Thorarchaeota archaeon]|nr:MAG: hypothetical protein C4K49_11415 [Candidatus Thorarchaeota archaeon]
MSPQSSTRRGERESRSRYLFKITVLGPEDTLLEEVLQVFSKRVVTVDGISISAADRATDGSDVKALIMSPKHDALDIMLSLTYKGANAAIIVLREADPEVEKHYRNEVRVKAGGLPTRVFSVGSDFNETKRCEILRTLDSLLEEILASRQTTRPVES